MDDLQVSWNKHQKDLTENMKTVITDLTRDDTGEHDQIIELATKIDELQLRIPEGNDHGSGINFKPYGNESSDPAAWWREFESCAEFKKYGDEKRLSALKVLLKGSLAVWLERTLSDDIPDTDSNAEKLRKIRNAFIEKYGKSNTWLDEHLIHFMSQKPQETVQKYYSRLMMKIARLNKTPQETLVIFVKGLRNQLKYYVLSREPANLEAAYKLAKSAESLIEISDMTGGDDEAQPLRIPGEVTRDVKSKIAHQAQRSAEGEMLSQLEQLRTEVRRLKSELSQSTQRNSRFNEVVRCRYCNIPGHVMRDCRARIRDLQQNRGAGRAPPLVNRTQLPGPRPRSFPPYGRFSQQSRGRPDTPHPHHLNYRGGTTD